MTADPAPLAGEQAPEPPAPPPVQKLKSPGVQAGDPLGEAGRKVLRFHFQRMLENEAGSRLGEDIEAVHDMRVATRRMRSAFDIFGPAFKAGTVKRWLAGLRGAGRALGRVRDLDVILDKAGQYARSRPKAERPALEPLLELWRQEREQARARLLAYLDGGEYAAFRRDFEQFLHTPGAGARRRPPALVPADGREVKEGGYRVQEAAPLLIYAQLASLRAYEQAFGPGLENAALADLHALRIDFKKFRYTLEFFREALGPEAKAAVETVRGLQDHLGDLNDANVAAASLQRILAGWEKRQAGRPAPEQESPEAVSGYLAYRQAERHRLRQSFPAAWERFTRPEFRRDLALAVSAL